MGSMKPQADPRVDYAFKHVFGREQSKPVLTSLLEAVLQPPPTQRIAALDLLNPFNDKEAMDDKLSILDIKARDQSGRHFNVEMQMLVYGAFRQRALYYWSRLHQSQLQEGMDYHILRPTVAICFVDTPLFAELAAYHLIFELRERRRHVLFTDQLARHILELQKFTKAVEALTTPLDRWLYFLRHAQDLDTEALPAALDVPEVRWALGDLVMISQSDQERERYEARLKWQRDVYTALVEAREQGRAEGEAKGEAKGRAEVQIARIHFLQRALHQAVLAAEQLRSLPYAELENLAADLERQLEAKLAGGA